MIIRFPCHLATIAIVAMFIGCERDATIPQPATIPQASSTTQQAGIQRIEAGNMKLDLYLDTVVMTDDEWHKRLTDEQYRVTRQHGTERAFTGDYWKTKTKGVYRCIACGQPLYSSQSKYDSGTGWPSFWQPVHESVIGTKTDRSIGMSRTEVHCKRCSAHLGHIFSDGPDPTGKRHCINSVSLNFVSESSEQ